MTGPHFEATKAQGRRPVKFQLAINMERITPEVDMRDVERHTLEMVQMADEGGFEIAWAAEHHALEMTIAPNPFQILTWWAAHTSRIRLGPAVVVAPYWHPINLAGEAALLDLYSGGRLEFGIGSGAYQREFDRMHPGLKQSEGYKYAQEMLPAVKALWAGDYEHEGEFWSFPLATSVPKPLQKPHPPIWVAARAPVTYDYAVKNDCNILSWPLTRAMSEVELYKDRLETALAENPGKPRPIFAVMRHSCVYDRPDDWEVPVKAAMRQLGQFENSRTWAASTTAFLIRSTWRRSRTGTSTTRRCSTTISCSARPARSSKSSGPMTTWASITSPTTPASASAWRSRSAPSSCSSTRSCRPSHSFFSRDGTSPLPRPATHGIVCYGRPGGGAGRRRLEAN
jgi:alkanesulfonate monooxygenase SsuD/methylene tetrahydromethanopterin reductase-like flavin-dependent oxidoreductase (luciferase family)